MSKNEELKELFEEWKAKQKEESYSADTIEVQHIDKESWCEDGFAFEEKSNTILYILSEANLNGKNKCDGQFWFKENYGQISHPIIDRIQNMQAILCNEIENLTIQDISYMNINKRGGFDTANENILKNYYERYKEFIIKEINILDPKLIVFATGEKGQAIYNDLINNIEKINCKNIIFMSHPSKRGITEAEYLEEFEKKIEMELKK
jgi:hypothetical protein